MIFNHAQEADYEKAYITKVHYFNLYWPFSS